MQESGCRKVLLIINTNSNTPHDPIYVCDPRKFSVQPDTKVPIVLAYNMAHYESLHPLTPADTQKTSELVEQYLAGNYPFGRGDMNYLLSTDNMEEPTANHDEAVTDVKEDRPKGAVSFQESLPEY